MPLFPLCFLPAVFFIVFSSLNLGSSVNESISRALLTPLFSPALAQDLMTIYMTQNSTIVFHKHLPNGLPLGSPTDTTLRLNPTKVELVNFSCKLDLICTLGTAPVLSQKPVFISKLPFPRHFPQHLIPNKAWFILLPANLPSLSSSPHFPHL